VVLLQLVAQVAGHVIVPLPQRLPAWQSTPQLQALMQLIAPAQDCFGPQVVLHGPLPHVIGPTQVPVPVQPMVQPFVA
jgi:hypothetical protein